MDRSGQKCARATGVGGTPSPAMRPQPQTPQLLDAPATASASSPSSAGSGAPLAAVAAARRLAAAASAAGLRALAPPRGRADPLAGATDARNTSARPEPPRAIGFWADIVPRAVESGFAADLAPLLNAFAFARAPPVPTGARTDWDFDICHRATQLAVAAGSQAKLRASWVWRHYRAAVFCTIEAAEWGQPAQAEHERKATWFEAHGMPPLCCDRCGCPEPKRVCTECDEVHGSDCDCTCCPPVRGGCGGDRSYCGCVGAANGQLVQRRW